MNERVVPNGENIRISAVVNTRNAALYLAETLESLRDFDEILVCDMESVDDTVEIALRYGAKVVTYPAAGCNIVEPARNYALSQARGEWALVVDADEVIPGALTSYLYDFISKEPTTDALYIARKNHLVGRWDRGTYPDYQLRFFRRTKCYWPPFVHSRPKIDGKVGYIPSRRHELAMIHQEPKLREVLERHNRYSDDQSGDMIAKGKNVTMATLIFKPWWRFFRAYIIKGGIFNGKAGYIAAKMGAAYKLDVLAKTFEKKM